MLQKELFPWSVFYNSHIWMNAVTLKELIIALSLAIGGLKLLTFTGLGFGLLDDFSITARWLLNDIFDIFLATVRQRPSSLSMFVKVIAHSCLLVLVLQLSSDCKL